VLAQTAYSTSSLSGTYAIQFLCIRCNSEDEELYLGPKTGIGTIQFDGVGGIRGGTITVSEDPHTTCVYGVNNMSGAYSIQSTGLGTGNLELEPISQDCQGNQFSHLSLAAADGGAAIQFVDNDENNVMSGTAIKQ
jgi:hypothetical protein